MAGKQPHRKAAKRHKLPEPIPEGKEITDTQKKTWVINKIIGSGGFGTVYCAADVKKPKEFDYVVKVEYHENGPLFAEMHCYQKIAKPATLTDWVKKNKLNYLGLSPFHGFGFYEHNGSKYRFMVLERFDKDLQKLLDENGKIFPLKTVCLIGLSVIDVLEYIHSFGYIHGDVKAANLLTGRKAGTGNQVYLVDMGLACKYLKDGIHKKDFPDPKKAHNGTPEFTSRDAHRGSFSRRGDLEILAYNLLKWLSGRLPWEDFISDNNKLQKEKNRYMANIDEFLKVMFPDEKCPSGVSKFLHYINELTFEEEPNYNHCKKLLKNDLKSIGCSNDNTLEFTKTKKKPVKASTSLVNTAPEQVSNKENGKQQKTTKRTEMKRKVKEEITFDEGKPKSRKKIKKEQDATLHVKGLSESEKAPSYRLQAMTRREHLKMAMIASFDKQAAIEASADDARLHLKVIKHYVRAIYGTVNVNRNVWDFLQIFDIDATSPSSVMGSYKFILNVLKKMHKCNGRECVLKTKKRAYTKNKKTTQLPKIKITSKKINSVNIKKMRIKDLINIIITLRKTQDLPLIHYI